MGDNFFCKLYFRAGTMPVWVVVVKTNRVIVGYVANQNRLVDLVTFASVFAKP